MKQAQPSNARRIFYDEGIQEKCIVMQCKKKMQMVCGSWESGGRGSVHEWMKWERDVGKYAGGGRV